VLGVLVGPSITALLVDLRSWRPLPVLALGMFVVVPVALDPPPGPRDITAPLALLRVALDTACRGYPRFAGCVLGLLRAASDGFLELALGHALWLQIAIVRPARGAADVADLAFLGTFAELHKNGCSRW